ncbi:MAG: DUF29 domain-containing protein [Cyanobacteria bacterium QH_7_48_89]|nr:MAG: DUF29 domain-containing protein [Cyanobacteria bacterium QH_7_48_89]
MSSTKSLYDTDYSLWLEKTAQLLRNGQINELDLPNLAEEIEDMGKREKRAVENNVEILLMHLLKYQYQPEKRSNSWKYTIFEHRDRLEKAFRDSPSLKPYSQEIFEQCYSKARQRAAIETGMEIDIFPVESPFTVEQTLNPNYLPE